jgi:DNA-binding CsgD family transcriptional regulator
MGRRESTFAAASGGADDCAEAHDGLAQALRWLGDFDASLSERERAHRLYLEQGDDDRAAVTAGWLGVDAIMLRGDRAVARGWFARGRRLVEGREDTPAAAWLGVAESTVLGLADPRLSIQAGEQAMKAGALGADRDLEVLGRAIRGLGSVALGDVEAGMADLDEAGAAALAGEVRSSEQVGRIWCYLIFACEQVRDVDRAAQWCDTVRRHAERIQNRQLFGFCRTHYAVVLTAKGAYDDAEEELEAATADFQAGAPAAAFEAAIMLAELRRRQGRLDETAALCEPYAHHASARLCMAEIAWDRGDVAAARELMERHRRQLRPDAFLADAAALHLFARIGAAERDPACAEEAARALAELADRARTDPLRAAASSAAGLAAVARGENGQPELEDAIDLWSVAGMPYEAARGMVTLARVVGPGADQALWTRAEAMLAELGCAIDVRSLDAPLGAPAGHDGELSAREVEVLRLVADGLSDAEIAKRLVLSPHTVHRHVANIRTKLGQPSRAAAAARAARDGLI